MPRASDEEQGTVEELLIQMRSKLQQSESNMGDAMSTFAEIEADVARLGEEARSLRTANPIVGELADTLISALGLCQRMYDQAKGAKPEKKGAPLSSTVPAPGDSGHPLPPGPGQQPRK